MNNLNILASKLPAVLTAKTPGQSTLEAIERVMSSYIRLMQTFASDSYKYYMADMSKCFEGWQYYQPVWMENDNRFDYDREAYLKTFFDPAHSHDTPYSETALLERLINNLEKAKHPVFKDYKQYLQQLLNNPMQAITATFKLPTMQRIIYPDRLEYADSMAELSKEQFKAKVNSLSPDIVFNALTNLSDNLKEWLTKAQTENTPKCKQDLIALREEALRWYWLDDITDTKCNMLLFRLKPELEWYINETERIYKLIDPYPSFEAMYKDAIIFKSIEAPENELAELYNKGYYELMFNTWLQTTKQWQYGDEKHYKALLTKKTWLEFLANKRETENQQAKDYEKEKQSWEVKGRKPEKDNWNFQYYKVDTLKRKVFKGKGDTRVHSVYNLNTEHEFDIANQSSYNEYGELIKEQTWPYYDIDFIHKLIRIRPVERVQDFLDYQFENCPDGAAFVKHIDTGAIINAISLSQKPSYQKELIKWIQEKKRLIKNNNQSVKTEKRNYLVLAFYYFYKQCVNEIEWFDNWAGGREKAYNEVVSKHYKNPPKTAWKQFQRAYTTIEAEHSTNRWQLCSKENYKTLTDWLKMDSPKGLNKAQSELNKPIT